MATIQINYFDQLGAICSDYSHEYQITIVQPYRTLDVWKNCFMSLILMKNARNDKKIKLLWKSFKLMGMLAPD